MILDGHTHIFPAEVIHGGKIFLPTSRPYGCSTNPPSPKWWVRRNCWPPWRTEGVEASVVLGFPWRRERHWRRHNEVILEAQRRWPQKFFGFCAAHPAVPGGVREIERCLAAGARGIGELAFYLRDRPRGSPAILAPVAELCQHYQVPLMLHATDRAGRGVSRPAPFPLAAVYQVIKAFPGDHLDSGPLGRAAALLRPAEEGGPRDLQKRLFRHRRLPLHLPAGDLPGGVRHGGPGKGHLRQRLPPAAPQPLRQGDGRGQPAGGLAGNDSGEESGAVDGGLAVSCQRSAISFLVPKLCLGTQIDCEALLRCPSGAGAIIPFPSTTWDTKNLV